MSIQSDSPYLQAVLKAYDQAILDYDQLKVRMETEVQKQEIAHFKTAQKNVKLLKDLSAAAQREHNLNAQIEELNKKIRSASATFFCQKMRVRCLQNRQHRLKADWENAIHERDRLYRRITDLTDQNQALLEANIALQREVNAIRRLPALENQLREINARIYSNIAERVGNVIAEITLMPLGVGAIATILSFPFLGPGSYYLGASAAVAYGVTAAPLPPSQAELDAPTLKNQRLELYYQIIQIKKGISTPEFLSLLEEQQNEIFTELGFSR